MSESSPTPLVSVLVTTYNHEKYIAQAIESILAQTCDFRFEVVIGEDCSTDRTRQICLDLQKKYPNSIHLILNKENKGLLKNFRDTFLQCQGKYIAECAGDDFWNDPFKLKKQVEILETNEDAVLVHTAWNELLINENPLLQILTEQKPIIKLRKTNRGCTTVLMNQTNQPFVYTCSACYRKALVEKIFQHYPQFFSENKYPCEDYQLVFFLLQEGTFYYIDDATITYRVLPESASHSNNPEKSFDFRFGVLKLRLDLFNELHLNILDSTDYLQFTYHSLLKLSFRLKRKDLAEKTHMVFNEIGFQRPTRDRMLYRIIQNRISLHLCHRLYLLKRIKNDFR